MKWTLESLTIVTIRITQWKSKWSCVIKSVIVECAHPADLWAWWSAHQFKCSCVSVQTFSPSDPPTATHPEAPRSHNPVELIHQHIDTDKRNQGLFRSGAGERNYLFILKLSPSFFVSNPFWNRLATWGFSVLCSCCFTPWVSFLTCQIKIANL